MIKKIARTTLIEKIKLLFVKKITIRQKDEFGTEWLYTAKVMGDHFYLIDIKEYSR